MQAFKSFTPAALSWLNPTTGLAAGLGYNLTQADYERCFNASSVAGWMDWNYCVDFTSYVFAFNNSAYFDRYTNSASSTLHAGEIPLVTGYWVPLVIV